MLTSSKKQRVLITIHPGLLNEVKKLHESVSGIIEVALKKYLDEKKKSEIRANLLAAAKDPERQKDDLEIAEDFFFAEI